ncbi:hypothetical protein IT575_04245 [bacterium]|nr:hypothetical protein [bacterium]
MGDLPKITVEALGPTPQSAAQNIDVSVTRAEQGYEVTLTAGEDFREELDQLFLEVGFDGDTYTPTNAASLLGSAPASDETAGGSELGVSGGGNEPVAATGNAGTHSAGQDSPSSAALTLAGQIDGNTIQFGAVAVDAGGSGEAGQVTLTPGTPLLSFTLTERGPGRAISSAPGEAPEQRAKNLDLRQDSNGNWVLSWDYTNPGDTNQDGVVSVMDLSPIGLHYLERVENGIGDSSRHVDTDSNGLINVQDVTAIGMNFSSELFAYQIEMREPGTEAWITVGQLLLGDQQVPPGETVRFSYTFGAQYVEDASYRVMALNKDLEFGPPSECLSQNAREIEEVSADSGQVFTVVVKALDLKSPMQQMSSVRVVMPESFSYEPKSFNVGSIGGAKDEPDGIWGTFAEGFLLAPDTFLVPISLGDGRQYIDFNVTVLQRSLEAAPVTYGDLFNFKLKSNGSEPLSLSFEMLDDNGRPISYFYGGDGVEMGDREFGNRVGIEIR